MTALSPTALEEAAKAMEAKRAELQYARIARIKGDLATAAITAYLAQREKEGFVMVPKEPTKEMIYDGNTTIDDCIDFWNYDSGSGYCVEPHAAAACYRTMLSVASQEQNDD